MDSVTAVGFPWRPTQTAEAGSHSSLLSSAFVRMGWCSSCLSQSINGFASLSKKSSKLQSALDAGIIFHAQTDVVRANMDTHGSVCELACLQPWFFGGVNWVDRRVYDLKIVGRSLWADYCHANLVSGMVFKLSSNVSGHLG